MTPRLTLQGNAFDNALQTYIHIFVTTFILIEIWLEIILPETVVKLSLFEL